MAKSFQIASFVAFICFISLVACDPLPTTPTSQDNDGYELEMISLMQKESEFAPPKFKKSKIESENFEPPGLEKSYRFADLEDLEKNSDYFDQEYYEDLPLMQEKHDNDMSKSRPFFAYKVESDSGMSTAEDNVEVMQADALSNVLRYVGVGYNLMKGNPEGDYNIGGSDPGIKLVRSIFKFSYADGKKAYYRSSAGNLPDQVEFHEYSSCAASNMLSAYSGQRSYQRQLSVSVQSDASYAGFAFGSSTGMKRAKAATEKQKKVNIEKEEICAYGKVRYLLENSKSNKAFQVTPSFYNTIKYMEVTNKIDRYFPFLDLWGTHIIVEADVGTRKVSRSYITYLEAYNYLHERNDAGISGSGSYLGFSSSFAVDISTLNEQIDSKVQVHKRIVHTSMGKESKPVPIHIVLKPITDALSPEYWRSLPNGDTYTSLKVAEKKALIEKALKKYPLDHLKLKTLKDPVVRIPNAWPDGTYALQSSTDGCPSGWDDGWRYHDTEDDNSNNYWSVNLPSRVRGEYNKNNLKQYYCVKDSSAKNYGLKWPKGRYCIAKKHSCPEHFHEGYIHWDDEDSNNRNKVWGSLPDGEYGSNTRIKYCCRRDERPEVEINLPTDKSFILYRYGGTCQKVAGMRVDTEYLRFDCEDDDNADHCDSSHPDDLSCDENHKLQYCYYHK